MILKYFFPTDCKNKETSGLHRQAELQQEGKRKQRNHEDRQSS